jgi:hypothetical protein
MSLAGTFLALLMTSQLRHNLVDSAVLGLPLPKEGIGCYVIWRV